MYIELSSYKNYFHLFIKSDSKLSKEKFVKVTKQPNYMVYYNIFNQSSPPTIVNWKLPLSNDSNTIICNWMEFYFIKIGFLN